MRLRAHAPVRVCDLGGWTDTWFAGHGQVMSLAVDPGVEVLLDAVAGRGVITIAARDYGEEYPLEPGAPLPGRHPLLEAAAVELGPPQGWDLRVEVHSEVPPGSSTGTSASVTVAILGVMNALLETGLSPAAIARAALAVEVDRLGLQSGVQDQLCAAAGGAVFIDMPRYPDASATRLALPAEVVGEVDRRLLVMLPVRGHTSSMVHEMVIRELEAEGSSSPRLEALRACAVAGRDALLAGRLDLYASVLVTSTEAQRRLHPGLVSDDLEALISTAAANGAVGWKVNGAGGQGGSVAFLVGPDGDRQRLADILAAEHHTHLPMLPSLCPTGLEVSAVPA